MGGDEEWDARSLDRLRSERRIIESVVAALERGAVPILEREDQPHGLLEPVDPFGGRREPDAVAAMLGHRASRSRSRGSGDRG